MVVHLNNYAKEISKDWYLWKVFVDEDKAVLDRIEAVQYLLPQAFPRPTQIVRDRRTKFALESSSSEGFKASVTIKFRDAEEEKVHYYVDMTKEWPRLEPGPPIGAHSVGDLAPVLGEIRKLTREIWQVPRETYFIKYATEVHSERIIRILNEICREMMKTEHKLSEQEIFILLASVYLHDIGLQYSRKDWLTAVDLRDKHHILSEEMILGSGRKLLDYPNLGVPEEYVAEIAKVSRGHRKTDLQTRNYETKRKKGENIRLRLLTALLSLANELDLSDDRVIIDELRKAKITQEDRTHWWRYYYVKRIDVERGRISIHFELPSNTYRKLVVASVERQIEQRIAQLKDIFWQVGIILYLGEHTIEISKKKVRMLEDDLKFLRSKQTREQKDGYDRTEIEMSNFLERAVENLGVNLKHRRYVINLKRHDQRGVLEGEILFHATVKNEANSTKKLFQDGKVLDGFTTIPDALRKKPPKNAEGIVSFQSLKIGGEHVPFEKSVFYLNSGTAERGVRREVVCNEVISPGATTDISYRERVLLDEVDNLSRRYVGISLGTVEVEVHHIRDVVPAIVWFKRFEDDVRSRVETRSPNLVVYQAEGKWLPGTGFLLSWKKKTQIT